MTEHAPKLSRRLAVVGVVLAQGITTWFLLLLWVLWAFGEFTWQNFTNAFRDSEVQVWLVGWSLGVMLCSVLLLMPIRKPAFGTHRGTSLYLSIAVAALGIAGLATGAVYLLMELAGLWEPMLEHGESGWFVLLAFIPGWILFTPLLILYSRRHRRETFLGRVSAGLCVGTVIEILAALPLDVMVRRRTDCYCAESTFLTLLWAGTVGLIAMGPAIVVPIVARRRKRWYAGRCEWCGYEMSGIPGAERCPECGLGWKSAATTKKSLDSVSHTPPE